MAQLQPWGALELKRGSHGPGAAEPAWGQDAQTSAMPRFREAPL